MQYFQHRFDSVQDYLHHRPPYLMVEEIESIEGDRIETAKVVSENLEFLKGHFPGAPVFPGAMMQEFLTQSAGILIAANYNPMEDYRTSDPDFNRYALGVLVKVERARYRRFARPGDRMRAEVRLLESIGTLFEFSGRIRIEQNEIMSIRFTLANIESVDLNGSE